MPKLDRAEIRKLAADSEIVTAIKIIDCLFDKLFTASRDACPEPLQGEDFRARARERIEDYWLMLKQGTLRLHDPEIDDDNVIVLEAVTPRQRARARVAGAKLFAVRQHLLGRRHVSNKRQTNKS